MEQYSERCVIFQSALGFSLDILQNWGVFLPLALLQHSEKWIGPLDSPLLLPTAAHCSLLMVMWERSFICEKIWAVREKKKLCGCLWSNMSQSASLPLLVANPLTTTGDAQGSWAWAGAAAGRSCPLQMRGHPSLSPGTAASPLGQFAAMWVGKELWMGPITLVQSWSKS